jgi:DNA polymerase elongation subunit (family B)
VPTGINGVDDYYDPVTVYRKSTPMHVKAALVFNHQLKKHGLREDLAIHSGDKIRYIHLKQPNPFHEQVIAVGVEMPEELEIPKYLDYHVQFEKTFMAPLKNILEVIGWRSENKATLDI